MSETPSPAANPWDLHPNLNRYRDGGMGGDENHNVVGMVRTRALDRFKEHDGEWNGQGTSYDREKIDNIRHDLRSGHGLENPIQMMYDPKHNWTSIGEGNHRLRALQEEGHEYAPVRVNRSASGEAMKNDGVGFHPDKDPRPAFTHNDYVHVPSDLHPKHIFNDDNLAEHQGPPSSGMSAEAASRSLKSDKYPSSIMIHLVPPLKVARKLAQPGGESVNELHVTLAYLGKTSEYSRSQLTQLPKLVEAWGKTAPRLKASISGAGTFITPDGHVTYAGIDIPHAGKWRESLVDMLESHGYKVHHNHGWTPHCSLVWSKHPVRFLPKVDPDSFDVGEVWTAIGGAWQSFPLSRTAKTAQEEDYRGHHVAPQPGHAEEGVGAPIHDLEGVMPDVYDKPHLYTGAYRDQPEGNRETVRQVRHARGNPEADVTVYRALPHPHRDINPGDWVSTSGQYARQHGYHATDEKQDWPVVKAKVKAKHLWSEGEIHEYGYHGPKIENAEYHFPGGTSHEGMSENPYFGEQLHRGVFMDVHPHEMRGKTHEQIAHHLLDRASTPGEGGQLRTTRNGLGQHWTDNEAIAREFSYHQGDDHYTESRRGHPTVLHGAPAHHNFEEDDPDEQERHGVDPFDYNEDEREVFSKRKAPVNIHGISWHDGNNWHRHNFNEPIQKLTAEKPPEVAGVAVKAEDTGRVLMLQRDISDDKDPAAGMWEFPGGHREDSDATLFHGAVREWQEETGYTFPTGEPGGTWLSGGIYKGFIHLVPNEDCVPIHDTDEKAHINPDDPDGDMTESLAWMDPKLLPKNPSVRKEVRDGTDWELFGVTKPVKVAALPKTQKCEYCKDQATQRLLWAEGMAYIPVCDSHVDKGKHCIEVTNHDEVVSVKKIAWRPDKRVFGPGHETLDPNLFTKEQRVKPAFRRAIMERLSTVLSPFYPEWKEWSRVNFAGSGATYWWDRDNNDVDILIGIDYKALVKAMPVFEGDSPAQIAKHVNQEFHDKFNTEHFGFGDTFYNITAYNNPNSWNIKDIHPYAAYDLTRDKWIVHPPEVHETPHELPDSEFSVDEQIANHARMILTLPVDRRKVMAKELWAFVHEDRTNAFSPRGNGVFDHRNLAEKYLAMTPDHLWDRLHEAAFE